MRVEKISTEISDLKLTRDILEKYLVRFYESVLCAMSALGDGHVCLRKFLFKFHSVDFM